MRPKLPGIYKELADVVGKQMRKENYITTVNGDRQRFIAEHQRRHRKVVRALPSFTSTIIILILVLQFSQATTDLCRENKCRQWPTALIPPLVQLPPFLLVSYMLRDLCVSDSSFATEAFLMLSKLAAPDETFALPIAVGLLTMANVEINAWFSKNVRGGSGSRTATAQEVEVATKAPEGQSAVQQSSKINLSDTLRGVMRALAVGRIIFTALAPGVCDKTPSSDFLFDLVSQAIALYWTASAAGGLVQTWIMNQLDIRRRAKSQSSKVQSDVLKTTAAPAKQALKPVSVKTKQRR